MDTSLNDGIPVWFCFGHSINVDDVVRMIQGLGAGALMAKANNRSDFLFVASAPYNYFDQLGFNFLEKILCYQRITVGMLDTKCNI